MASNARSADDWRWAEELRGEDLGFAPFNVMAVFRTLSTAEQAVRRLRDTGLPNDLISLRSRTLTDDPGFGVEFHDMAGETGRKLRALLRHASESAQVALES